MGSFCHQRVSNPFSVVFQLNFEQIENELKLLYFLKEMETGYVLRGVMKTLNLRVFFNYGDHLKMFFFQIDVYLV